MRVEVERRITQHNSEKKKVLRHLKDNQSLRFHELTSLHRTHRAFNHFAITYNLKYKFGGGGGEEHLDLL